MKYRWSLAPSQPVLSSELARALQISPILAQCLLNRGLADPAQISLFLQPRLKHLADPFLLPNMAVAVDRLLRARELNELVVIFGDYDVDGVTSTAILIQVLRALGWRAEFHLPHRFEEGYGLSQEGLDHCLKKFQPKVLLAVDCGSAASASIGWLQELGIDAVVLDHHQISNPAPPALALVNPLASQSKVENGAGRPRFSELCSAGLAFKLAHALVKRGREAGWPAAFQLDLRELLELVALGTIADIVPVTGENRIFVSLGLARLNATTNPGLIALREVAQIEGVIGSYEVGFQLAPRLNAAGRLENAEEALHLILARNRSEAEPIARSLDGRNRERQAIERTISTEVIESVRARFNPETDYMIVEGQERWHIGVVGIVASRVLREFYRPSIIIGGQGSEWRGSGRSIEGFDLSSALRGCDSLLIRHGGHAMAAGITIQPEKIEALRMSLNEAARRTLTREQLQPTLRCDAEIKLDDLTIEGMTEWDLLKPSGPENPQLHFVLRGVSHQRPPQRMGMEKQHVKFWVTDGTRTLEAVWWNCGNAAMPKVMYDLVFTPQINEFNGRCTVQLKVLDWRNA